MRAGACFATPIRSWLRYASFLLCCHSLNLLSSRDVQFVSARVYETRAQMNAGKIGDSEKPLLSRLLQSKYSPTESMPDLDIISEAMGHMFVYLLYT